MKLVSKFVIVVVALGSVSVAQADLISIDDAVFGADSITWDTESGLEWLDLSESLNLTYNDMVGSENDCNPICSIGSFEGWTFATEADVNQLMSNAGLNPYSLTTDITSQLANDILAFVELTGPSSAPAGESCEGQGSCRSIGLTSDLAFVSGLTRAIIVAAEYEPSPEQFHTYNGVDDGIDIGLGLEGGIWLYRPVTSVPEPSTLALLGLGLFGMGLARRRKV